MGLILNDTDNEEAFLQDFPLCLFLVEHYYFKGAWHMILDFIQKEAQDVALILGTALFAFYLIIYKCIQVIGLSLRYRNKSSIDQIRLHIKEKQYEQARQCIRHKGPKEKILLKGIDCIEQDYSKDVMKERLEMIYEEEVHELDKGLPLILI